MKTPFKYELNAPANEMPSRMPGGIHTGVQLTSIRIEDLSPTNPTKVLRFTFQKDGMQFRHTELPVNEESIATWKFVKTSYEQTVARKYRELGERLKHIFTAITGETNVRLQACSWDEFCRKYIELAGDKYRGKQFAIKVVYNEKGYTTFPGRVISAFIVPDEQSGQLRIGAYDMVNPPVMGQNPLPAASDEYPPEFSEPYMDGMDESIQF